ncbi:MAG: SDR family oxidoreductase [Alphaproteobacteria bacterium]|nr:SDR family oxidoreductase [Alphaproteobacteria bacterium]
MPLSDYKTALVTGASSGIGAATVRALAGRGLQVHALARRQDRLKALADETGCTPIALDLRDRDAICDRLSSLEVDILVGNAGTGRGMEGLLAATPEDIDITLGINVQGLVHVLRAVLPGMVERKRGHVVNIGSTAGLYPLYSVIYGASKGAVHLLNQNLRIELKGSGVRSTEILPGRVVTEIFDVSFDDKQKAAEMKDPGIEQLQPEDIADAIIFALDAPWRMNVNMIEVQPTEQVFGGLAFAPAR